MRRHEGKEGNDRQQPPVHTFRTLMGVCCVARVFILADIPVLGGVGLRILVYLSAAILHKGLYWVCKLSYQQR